MFIRTAKSSGNRDMVYLAESYRENGKPKQRILKSYGFLDELLKDDLDFMEKLKEEVRQQNAERKTQKVSLPINCLAKNKESSEYRYLGSLFPEAIYNELDISGYFAKETQKNKFNYPIDEIFRLLTIGRIMDPDSKKGTYENRNHYFHECKFQLDDIYRSLDVLERLRDTLQLHLHKKVTEVYGRDCSLTCYDVTNYYFETEIEDDIRAKGVSKEHRPEPIVQMGLFIDRNGLPVSYQLFRGNTLDKKTLKPVLEKLKREYSLGRIIVVADKGLNSGENLDFITGNYDGYVVAQQIRKSKKEFIEMVLDEGGYVYNENRTFKLKSFIRDREVRNGKGIKTLKEKVVLFWSLDYEKRERHKRGDLEETIQRFRENPSLYKASNRFGVKKYLKPSQLNKETGELEKQNVYLQFDEEKYQRDCALDGYYAICSSEIDLTDGEIIDKYRGLSKIEESFKVIKSQLEGRPVFVWTPEHIEAHFLVCFVSLLIARILEMKLNHKYSMNQIQEALQSARCVKMDKGIYHLEKHDPLMRDIEKAFQTSIDYAYLPAEVLGKVIRQLKVMR